MRCFHFNCCDLSIFRFSEIFGDVFTKIVATRNILKCFYALSADRKTARQRLNTDSAIRKIREIPLITRFFGSANKKCIQSRSTMGHKPENPRRKKIPGRAIFSRKYLCTCNYISSCQSGVNASQKHGLEGDLEISPTSNYDVA